MCDYQRCRFGRYPTGCAQHIVIVVDSIRAGLVSFRGRLEGRYTTFGPGGLPRGFSSCLPAWERPRAFAVVGIDRRFPLARPVPAIESGRGRAAFAAGQHLPPQPLAAQTSRPPPHLLRSVGVAHVVPTAELRQVAPQVLHA